jgi:integrase/recombinase XerC
VDAVEDHLAWLKLRGLSPNTIRSRKSVLTTLSHSIPVPLLEAGPDQLLTWRCEMSHIAPSTISSYVSHARQFYAWALQRRLVAGDPTAGLPTPQKPVRLPRPIAWPDLVIALEHSAGQLRVWLVLAAWCGLRACEIARLRADCIMAADIRPYLVVAADATKGSRERTVPLAPFVLAELAAAGLPARGWAFRRADGRPGHPQPWSVSQICGRHLHGLGIPATLHMLRHWAITEFYEASGYDTRATMEFAGHVRMETSALYTRVRPGRAAAAVARMPVPARRLRSVS